MRIIYNTILPVVISPCKAWPNGKNLTGKDRGLEFDLDDKSAIKFLKTNLFVKKGRINDVNNEMKMTKPKSINLDKKEVI